MGARSGYTMLSCSNFRCAMRRVEDDSTVPSRAGGQLDTSTPRARRKVGHLGNSGVDIRMGSEHLQVVQVQQVTAPAAS